jgi:NAD+ synthetase
MDRSVEIQVREICGWLSLQVQYAEARGVVLVIDGALNTAVTAALAQKALGDGALGLVMSIQSSKKECDDAMQVVNHLGLRYEQISLHAIYDPLLQLLPKADSPAALSLQARLHMAVLYHYAACRDALVLGSGDRSDWEIGKFTKCGDGVGDIFPISHLLKSEVYNMARYLKLPGRLFEGLFAENLWPERKGGSESGFGYRELDAYLSGDFMRVSNECQRKIRSMQQAAFYKKRPPSKFSPADGISESESSLSDDHEAYDKSIEALTIISKAITSDQYLEDILRLIVMVTAEVMNSSVCSLWLLDEKEGVLRLRATQSIDREYLKDRVLKVGEGIVGKVVAENRAYIVGNVLVDPIFKEKELARRMGLVSMLSMPMRVKDRVIGVINCYTSHPHAFSDLQMNVLTTVANQAAVAIEKTELIVQTKVIQEELERRKIIERAKDLLMKRLDLSGEEAYRWLQKRSMNTRKSMREVSEAVLLTMEG